jgi:hypothetical protein
MALPPPRSVPWNEDSLDASDGDLSSGGVLLLPAQPCPFSNLAVTAGKSGTMYLLNRASLPQQSTRRKNNRALLVRAVLFHRSGWRRACGKQRRRRLEQRPNRRLESPDLADGCTGPRSSCAPCPERPGWRNLYDGFVERHTSWNSHHMGDRTTDRY